MLFYFCHLLNVFVESHSLVLNGLSLEISAKIRHVVVTRELDPKTSCESGNGALLWIFPRQLLVGSNPRAGPESYPKPRRKAPKSDYAFIRSLIFFLSLSLTKKKRKKKRRK